jgi:hypothetical protein
LVEFEMLIQILPKCAVILLATMHVSEQSQSFRI